MKKDEGSDSENEPMQGDEADLRDVRYILEKLGSDLKSVLSQWDFGKIHVCMCGIL